MESLFTLMRAFRSRFGLWIGFALLLCLFPGGLRTAIADELDPFDVDRENWISFEHYSDKESRFPSPEEPSDDIISPPEMASSSAHAQETPVSETAPETVQAAEPARPLQYPVMPGANLGYDVFVDSSDQKDDAAYDPDNPQLTRPVDLPVMPGVTPSSPSPLAQGEDDGAGEDQAALPQDNAWKDAKAAAKAALAKKPAANIPINVRLAILPDERVKAAPGKPIIRPRKEPHEASKKIPVVKKPPDVKKSEPEACAALTAFRKKQLEAIESDRKTLSALQEAIAELGLDKKLDFMNNVSPRLTPVPVGDAKPSEVSVQAADGKEPSTPSAVSKN